MSEFIGLRRVLELLAPSVRSANAAGTFAPSSYATPLSVAAHALGTAFVVCVTATSSEAELLRESVAALLGGDDDVVIWPGWDTHPLERVSPDTQSMAQRSLLRWRIAEGDAPHVLVASARSISQILSPEGARAPQVVVRGSELDRDEFISALASSGYRRESLVEHRAEFAVRGGIVDVWPAQGNEPIRLDFFGDDVDRLTTFDIANQRQDIPDRGIFQSRFQDLITGDVAFGGFFDSIKNHYVFVITSYVQTILDGKDEDYGTFLSVTPSTEFDYLSPSLGVADRAVIGSGSKNSSGILINPSNRIKLNIFYTKIN